MARKLGETLIELGAINQKQLQEALRSQRIFGSSLGTNLLQLGFVDETTLGRALGAMYRVDVATRADVSGAPPEVIALLPSEFARRHRALPFRVEGQTLYLAMQNPADTLAIHEAAFLTGFQVQALVCPESVLRNGLSQHLRFDPGPARRRYPDQDEPTGPVSAEPDIAHPLPGGFPPDGPESERPEGSATPSTAPSSEEHALPAEGEGEREQPPVEAAPDERPLPGTTTAEIAVEALRTGPVGIDERAARRPAGVSEDPLASAGRALANAQYRDQVLEILLEELAEQAPRAGIFLVKGESAVMWKGHGFEMRGERRVEVPLDAPSVFDPVQANQPFSYGPVAMTPVNEDFYTLLGGRTPRVALVAPVFVKKRPILVLYGDDPRAQSPPPNFRLVRRLAAMAAWAIESLILRAKILRESGALGRPAGSSGSEARAPGRGAPGEP